MTPFQDLYTKYQHLENLDIIERLFIMVEEGVILEHNTHGTLKNHSSTITGCGNESLFC